jgi:hypothetical protein
LERSFQIIVVVKDIISFDKAKHRLNRLGRCVVKKGESFTYPPNIRGDEGCRVEV